jgi:hypothetical protein
MPESIHYVPLSAPMPKPTPEHQRKITRGKVFEVVTVITLICTGTAFLYWRGQSQAGGPDAAETVRASIAAVEAGAAAKMGEEGAVWQTYLELSPGYHGIHCTRGFDWRE